MRLRLLFLLIILGLLSMPGSAQIPGNKLFAYSNGDLWTWFTGGSPTQITEWGFNGGPILSPDARYITYLSLSTEGVAEIQSGQGFFNGTPPNNIWVMDTATQLAERVAQQDSYPTLRGVPAWSPRGRELAWLEFPLNDAASSARLVVYDMETRRTTILSENVNLGFQDAGYFIHSVQWGAGGISRLYFTFAENGQMQHILEIYNAETGELTPFLLAASTMEEENTMVPVDYVWVQHQGQQMIAVLTRAGTWYLLDPATGSRFELSRPPALINDLNTTALTPIWQPAESWQIAWQVTEGQINHTLPFTSYSISQGTPAVSPDGMGVAWNDMGDIHYMDIVTGQSTLVLDSNQTSGFTMPISIAWTAMTWQTKGDAGAALPTPVVSGNGDACGMATRLAVGNFVTVEQGQQPNNVRGDARLSAAILGVLAAGEVAQITQGPVCADGFRWWYISNETLAGWTAEGSATQYWLVRSNG